MAKRLLDFGVHPPTIYFPLNVEEGMMIEPTETESKETLDYFIDAMLQIADEVESDPDKVLEAPHTTIIDRLDETTAARKPILKFEDLHQENFNIVNNLMNDLIIRIIKLSRNFLRVLFLIIIFSFNFTSPFL